MGFKTFWVAQWIHGAHVVDTRKNIIPYKSSVGIISFLAVLKQIVEKGPEGFRVLGFN